MRENIMKLMRVAMLLVTILFFANNLSAAEQMLTVVHTNDMHSHVQGFSPEIDYRPLAVDADKTLGGWSRIATVIKNIKKERSFCCSSSR
jgi:2',3'-cyclic-nucleotide 2'-phosphodiesterase (5'-nucleotidase family)